ncbi:MAG: hypothetical protein ACSHX0_11890 [Akkermansiaceae bacterium]
MRCSTKKALQRYRTITVFFSALILTQLSASAQNNDTTQLIQQLNHKDFQTREAALEQLWQLGTRALPALQEAAASSDPEITARAENLVFYISIGLLPNSPQEVIELVIQYSKNDVESKLTILRQLIKLDQWEQALRITKITTPQETDKSIIKYINNIAKHYAQKSILADDLNRAAEILNMTPDSPSAMIQRAWLERFQGKEHFEKIYRKALAQQGEENAPWRIALHRVNGDSASALAEVEKYQVTEFKSLLQLFEGNAEPWLTDRFHNLNQDEIVSTGCKIQLSSLLGDHQTVQRELAFLKEQYLNKPDDTYTNAWVMFCLAANGIKEPALDILLKHYPEDALVYYQNHESPENALLAIGIPEDAKLPYTEWVTKTIQQAIVEGEESILWQRLMVLASFLHGQGEFQHSLSVLTPLMKHLKDGDQPDSWYLMLSELTRSGLGQQAIEFIKKDTVTAEELDGAIQALIIDNFELESRFTPWQAEVWEYLKSRNANNLPQAVDEIGLLSGHLPDPTGRADKLHQALIDEVLQNPQLEPFAFKQHLFEFARKRNNYKLAAQMTNEFVTENQDWQTLKNYFDLSLHHWAEVEPHLAQLAEENPENYDHLINWYLCLRKLEEQRTTAKNASAKVFNQILLLTLSDQRVLVVFADRLYHAGYDADAIKLWKLSAITHSPESPHIDRTIQQLATRGQHLYHTNQWKMAAALSEAYIQSLMANNLRRSANSYSISNFLNARFNADLAHGMVLYKEGNREQALAMFEKSHKLTLGSGLQADEFFPALRRLNLGAVYDRWVAESYAVSDKACKFFPQAHNSHNTAAWLTSRAVRQLDEGLRHAEIALKLRPHQGAYLDTMAEVWFAKGNRAKAIKWSEKAVSASITHPQGSPQSEGSVFGNYKMLIKQQQHFRHDPLPQIGK